MTARLRAERGLGLIELLIAVVMGLGLSLAISTMVSKQEAVRRGVTSGNDVTGNMAYISYIMDRDLRAAGSGISQNVTSLWGCEVTASRNNQQILPAPAAFPAPFATMPQSFRLAPVVAYAGQGANGSDVLAIVIGNSALSESTLPLTPGSATAMSINLSNTVGLRGGDLVLISEAGRPCMMQQVTAGYTGGTTQMLNFGGRFAAGMIGTLPLATYGIPTSFFSTLGNETGNQPRLFFVGLGDNATLQSLDLLGLNQTTPQVLAEGVVDMRVRYGVDDAVTRTNQVTSWVSPGDPGYTAAELTAYTPASQNQLQRILALRVGLILRSDQIEKEVVTPAKLTLFSSLGVAAATYTYQVPTTAMKQRYRAVEFTVPLRNVRDSR